MLFLRVMAGVSMLKGLYHWSRVCGIGVDASDAFQYHSIAWQAATVFFAVIDLVAAVGLWLAAAWGAVIWLTAIASMLAVEIFFPQVFGASLVTGMLEGGLLVLYLWLALKSAQEQAPNDQQSQLGRAPWRASDSSGSAIWVCRWRRT